MKRDELTKAAAQADVVVLLDYPNMDGIVTTMVDVYINLKALGVNALFVTITPEDIHKAAKLAVRMLRSVPLPSAELNFTKREDAQDVHTRRLLVSFGALMLSQNFTMIADERLVVLDAGTVLNDRLNYGKRGVHFVAELAEKMDVRILGNKCHMVDFQGLNYQLYRQMFSRARLEHIAKTFNDGDEVFDENKRGLELPAEGRIRGIMREQDLGAKKLMYQRWNEIVPGVYSENIGKVIFEFRWMDRPVHYSATNRTQPDGLTEYLALFGVDDTVDQDLTFTHDEVDRMLVGLPADDPLMLAVTK